MKHITTALFALALLIGAAAATKAYAETKELDVRGGSVTIPVEDLEKSKFTFFKTVKDGDKVKYYLITNTDDDTVTLPRRGGFHKGGCFGADDSERGVRGDCGNRPMRGERRGGCWSQNNEAPAN